MGGLMRSHDWSASPLGDPSVWPQSLRSVVGLLLSSKFPMFVAWGDELGFLYNDAYAEVLGAKHPAALGARFHDIWAEIWPDIAPLIEAAMAGQATYRENLSLVMNRQGFDEQTWFTFSYSPVRDESGRVAGMFCACTETTGRVLAERRQAFRLELDARLREAAEPRAVMAAAVETLGRHLGASRVGFSEVQADDETILCEACFADGVEPLVGTFSLADFGPDSVARQRRGHTEVWDDLEADPGQVRETWAAIETRSFVSVPLVREGRLRASLYVNFRDIHRWTAEEVALVEDVAARTWDAVERAQAEKALSDSEARLRALTDNLPSGMVYQVATGRDGSERRFLYLSQSHEALTGIPAEAVLADPSILYGLVLPEHRQVLAEAEAAAIRERRPFDIQVQIRRADGEVRWFRMISAPREQPDGSLIWDGIQIDIEDQKRAEARLRDMNETLEAHIALRTAELVRSREALAQAQKMEAMGQLTGGIAHDFNNLLQGLSGSLELIRRKPHDADYVHRWAEAGLEAAERGAKLTGQLLAFSRAQRIELQPLIVSDLVAGMHELLARTLGPMIKLHLELDNARVPVRSDPTQLELAVLNLAINSRDAMPEGGALTIATVPSRVSGDAVVEDGDYVELVVTDTGAGMAPEVVARAFDPFFTTKDVGKGTGLGLSQAYGIARQAGGTARIESRPGAGTTVRLFLRRVEAEISSEPRSDRQELQAERSAATVLVVDDDADVRGFLVASLDALGYRAIEAADGPAGLSALERFAPDLMLLDFAMPGMNGAEVARAARLTRPDLPIIFASGYAETATIEDAAGGSAIILRKPFRIDNLGAVLAAALNGPGMPPRPRDAAPPS